MRKNRAAFFQVVGETRRAQIGLRDFVSSKIKLCTFGHPVCVCVCWRVTDVETAMMVDNPTPRWYAGKGCIKNSPPIWSNKSRARKINQTEFNYTADKSAFAAALE